MVVESVEIVLIFFFSFIVSAFVILLVTGQVDTIVKLLNRVEDKIAKNNFIICYDTIQFLNNSSINCKLSQNFLIEVQAVKTGVVIKGIESVRLIPLQKSVKGYGLKKVQLYNFNNTIYIV